MNGKRWNGASVWMLAAAVGVGCLAAPTAAGAGDWSFRVGVGGCGPRYVRAHRTAYYERGYDLRSRRVWVEPEYAERMVRVEVPAVVRTRQVPVYDRYGRVVDYRLVEEVIEPARVEYRPRRSIVREGYYRTAPRRVRVEPVVRRVVHRRRALPALSVGFGYQTHRGHVRHHRGRRHHGFRVAFGR